MGPGVGRVGAWPDRNDPMSTPSPVRVVGGAAGSAGLVVEGGGATLMVRSADALEILSVVLSPEAPLRTAKTL